MFRGGELRECLGNIPWILDRRLSWVSGTVFLDQSRQLRSLEFCSLLAAAEITAKSAEVESQNTLEDIERYHYYLRNIFEHIRTDHTELSLKLILQFAVKAHNDTYGPNELELTLLVFEVDPRIPLYRNELSIQRKRMRVLHKKTKAQMAAMTAKARLKTAVSGRAHTETDAEIKIGGIELVFCDQQRRWMGPHCVIDVNEKVIHVKKKGRLVQHSIDRCKRCTTKEEVWALLHDENNLYVQALRQGTFGNKIDSAQQDATWRFPQVDSSTNSILVVRSIDPRNPRAQQTDPLAAKKKGRWSHLAKGLHQGSSTGCFGIRKRRWQKVWTDSQELSHHWRNSESSIRCVTICRLFETVTHPQRHTTPPVIY